MGGAGGCRGPAVGGRPRQGQLAPTILLPAPKLHASIHKPLCELSSTGFRQLYNVLQGTSWRAAKAVIRGNIISPASGLEKARNISQKGAAALEQKTQKQAVAKKLVK